jgi:hypothetical protein
MASISQEACRTHSAVVLAFAELSCISAQLANAVLESFPEYRSAKSMVDHSFWATKGAQMLSQINASIAAFERTTASADSFYA